MEILISQSIKGTSKENEDVIGFFWKFIKIDISNPLNSRIQKTHINFIYQYHSIIENI